MKRYFTFLLFILLVNVAFAQEELKEEYKTLITTFVDAVKNDDTQTLKTLVKYPLNREYPIPDVKDENDFVVRYDQIFDDVLKNIIINSKLDKDWETVGWRGMMLYSGVLWLDYDGRLIGLNYQSKTEEDLLKSLLEEDKNSLHKSLVNFKRPILIFETDKFRIRIDELENDLYRYTSWSVDLEMNEKPNLVIEGGELFFEGSGGNHIYKFTNGDYRYECAVFVIGSNEFPDISAFLNVFKNDEELIAKHSVSLKI